MVAIASTPDGNGKNSPRSLVTRNFGPSTAWAAVAPSKPSTSGCTASSSRCHHWLHAAISAWFGFLCKRTLPPRAGSNLKCFTAFVTYTSERSMPASSSASSRMRPAGPTNGRPLRSSWSPGCSPININGAADGPSPNTVCVAGSQRSQSLQCAACARSSSRTVTSAAYPRRGRRVPRPANLTMSERRPHPIFVT